MEVRNEQKTGERSGPLSFEQIIAGVKQVADVANDKGIGLTMFAIGAILLLFSVTGRFILGLGGADNAVIGVIVGAALMAGGSATKLYASRLTMMMTLETDKLHSKERLEEMRITEEQNKRRSEERKQEARQDIRPD